MNAATATKVRGTLATSIALQVALVAAVLSVAAEAADLPDPTRPPLPARRPASAPAMGAAMAPGAPVLQSILIGEGRPPSAIISGRLVQIGDRVDDMRVSGLGASGAVLTGPRGSTRLPLTPAADKRYASTPAPRLASPAAEAAPTARARHPIQVADQK